MLKKAMCLSSPPLLVLSCALGAEFSAVRESSVTQRAAPFGRACISAYLPIIRS